MEQRLVIMTTTKHVYALILFVHLTDTSKSYIFLGINLGYTNNQYEFYVRICIYISNFD